MDTNDALRQAAGLTLIEIVGDYGAKVQNPFLAYGGYNILAYQLTNALKENSLILTNSYWDALSNIATTALGYSMGERPSLQQWIGISLITLGIFLIQIK